ncbi:MBL fold metallo-hydrolase [Rufibacter psychrotolerans]|uniref:MBL fold metallo-hydrolase n=1 Tax=Rufibacter psychrotolerans TaxID=2812556 RepID=UPI0019676FF2|nr:MBL fold metallo-hydrolase [Rufibacter sp. SYSU D00308]
MATSATIQLIRNATLRIQYAGHHILVDPMFFPQGAFDPLAGKARNPMVELPLPAEEIIKDIDLVLVTHTHPDHFDPIASEMLDKSVQLFNQPADEEFFQAANFLNATTIGDHTTWNNLTIHRTGGLHGSGEILKKMGTVSGFVLQAQDQPTIYLVGDSIWTEEVELAIQKFRPDYIVANTGGAVFPGFEEHPILMDEEQARTLVQNSGNAKVIAVHMEALDHCRTTRTSLRQVAEEANISKEQLIIPQDGEVVHLVL